ncbi:ATP-binding protein [Kitasatospora sp. NPDC056181]|uniref:ATP-binding protein n=1 Tax=Kitasatospora sp. NPDC056181 TaxID=3345737 RepID=UPI0035DFA28D
MTVEIFSAPARASEISRVRRHVPVALARLGITLPPDETDTVVLLVSELATNAVVHGSHRDDSTATLNVEFRFVRSLRRLRVLVLDTGRGRPCERKAGPDAEDGRGLFLVAQLATDHGTELGANGSTIVWFEVPVADEPVATPPGQRWPPAGSRGGADKRAPDRSRSRDPLGTALTACWAAGHVIVLGLLGQLIHHQVEDAPTFRASAPLAGLDGHS